LYEEPNRFRVKFFSKNEGRGEGPLTTQVEGEEGLGIERNEKQHNAREGQIECIPNQQKQEIPNEP